MIFDKFSFSSFHSPAQWSSQNPWPLPNNRSCGSGSFGQCQRSSYRTIDGSCNNLDNPTWGMAQTRYARLLPAIYSDGEISIRKSYSTFLLQFFSPTSGSYLCDIVSYFISPCRNVKKLLRNKFVKLVTCRYYDHDLDKDWRRDCHATYIASLCYRVCGKNLHLLINYSTMRFF